jgi:hypothetical protein
VRRPATEVPAWPAAPCTVQRLYCGYTVHMPASLEARGDVVCRVCKYTVSSQLYDEKVDRADAWNPIHRALHT